VRELFPPTDGPKRSAEGTGLTDPTTTDPDHSGSVVTTPVNGHDSGPAGSLLGSPGSVTFANARVGETSTGQRWPGDVNFC
jgi:hypothetical protein